MSACEQCPLDSTTLREGQARLSACVCNAFYYLDSKSKECRNCPTGSNCSEPGTTLAALPVKTGYWKVSNDSIDVKPCPHATCAAGAMGTARYDPTSDATCTAGRGLAGVYCMLCKHAERDYFAARRDGGRCEPCGKELTLVGVLIGGSALGVLLLLLSIRYNLAGRCGCVVLWHQLRVAARRISLMTKAKICLGYYQVVTQIDRVYSIVFPPQYAQVIEALDSLFHTLFGWIPGVATTCTGLRLEYELYLLCSVPLVLMSLTLAMSLCRGRSPLAALPTVLMICFFCFPFVSSRGFRALAPCDCFDYVDGTRVCFLRTAYSIRCEPNDHGDYTAPFAIRRAAWLTVRL